MAVIEDLQACRTKRAAVTRPASLGERAAPPGGMLAAINGVKITGAQMRAAIDAIAHIRIDCEADVLQHAILLCDFAERETLQPADYAGPALHARAIAMDRWCQRHDPYGQSDIDAFFEAGATSSLVQTDEGVCFEPEAFGELVTFITELPF